MSSLFPLCKARKNIFTQHFSKQTLVDQAVAKHLRTLKRPSSQEVPALVANLAATREHYKDIARQFILDRDYPREDIDEDHLTLEVELYLFVALGQPNDLPRCSATDGDF
jgi:hypothetical protein